MNDDTPRVIGDSELYRTIRDQFESGKYWLFLWHTPTTRFAEDLERRFAGKDHTPETMHTMIITTLYGAPCLTWLAKDRLSVPRLRGWLLEAGFARASRALTAQTDTIALAASSFDPVLINAVNWLKGIVNPTM